MFDTICGTWRKLVYNFSALLGTNLLQQGLYIVQYHLQLVSISWFEPSPLSLLLRH